MKVLGLMLILGGVFVVVFMLIARLGIYRASKDEDYKDGLLNAMEEEKKKFGREHVPNDYLIKLLVERSTGWFVTGTICIITGVWIILFA